MTSNFANLFIELSNAVTISNISLSGVESNRVAIFTAKDGLKRHLLWRGGDPAEKEYPEIIADMIQYLDLV